MVNGRTRTCGLIGYPVEHTLSPVIHNFLAEQMGDNLVYVPFSVNRGLAGDAVRGAWALNLLGCNVTVPYKSEVIPYLAQLDPLAEQIGAVNTLVRSCNGFKGYNTDMPGLYRAMVQDQVAIEGERVLILGAGGVARAVAVLLAGKGASEVVILNRTIEKAEAIAEEVNTLARKALVRSLPLGEYDCLPAGERYLAIQATSVGMHPGVEDVIIDETEFYRKIHTGYDLIFNPADTRFMQLTRESGGRSFNGARMLLYQGIIAYELWTGHPVEEALAGKAYVRMLEAMKG